MGSDSSETGSAAVLRDWRKLRDAEIVPIKGELNASLDPVTLVATARVNHVLHPEPGAIAIQSGEVDLRKSQRMPPELIVGVRLITVGEQTDEGVVIQAVAPVWRRVLDELARDPEAIYRLDWRQTEELVAGAYREAGWTVRRDQ